LHSTVEFAILYYNSINNTATKYNYNENQQAVTQDSTDTIEHKASITTKHNEQVKHRYNKLLLFKKYLEHRCQYCTVIITINHNGSTLHRHHHTAFI